MKVAICHKDIAEPTQGGICTVYKNLAIELSRLGVEITVITSHKSWEFPSIKRITLNYLGSKIAYAKEIAKIIRQIKPDIAECSNWGYELLFCTKSTQLGTKIIVRSDPAAVTLFGNGVKRDGFYEKELLQKADYRLAVSNFAKRDLESKYGIKINRVILNGVDLTTFRPLNLSNKGNFKAKKIVWIGKPTKMKGFDILQKIITKAPSDYQFSLVIGRSKLSIPIMVNNLPNVIIQKNLPINALVLLLNEATVFLSTSRVEGFGLAALEAMACGTPVIAPQNLESVREFIREGKDGFFYNNPLEIFTLLEKVSPKMSLFARNQAEKFSWKYNALRTLEVYKKVLQCRK